MKGTQGKKRRQESALNMLEGQLKRGTKPEKIGGKTTNKMVQLSDSDKKRIKEQINKLTKHVRYDSGNEYKD